MKHIFSILLCLSLQSGFSQIVKTVGLSYTNGTPTYTPAKAGSLLALDTVTWRYYTYNGSGWISDGYRIQTISGCSAPNYTPTKFQSLLVINACTEMQGGPELYYYTGSVWLQINEGQTYTAGTGIGIAGGVISADTSLLATANDLNLKLDKNASFGGDVGGAYDNLQLGAGVVGPTELASTTVTPGSYTYMSGTVDADGRLTAASSGTSPLASLNGQTGVTQTFATGISGTDFSISSSGNTHTFNLPTASASNRGALSSTDWSTFNSKVGGSGTANYIPKFTASGAVTNSILLETSGRIQATSNTSSQVLPIFQVVNNYADAFVNTMECLAPNVTNGQEVYMAFGRAATNYERASISYYHAGNSSASNSLRFGLFGASGLLNIQADGKAGLGTTSPTSRADINGANGYSQLRLRATYTPTSSADSLGNTGDIAWDANYFYIKTAAGWKRAALSTF